MLSPRVPLFCSYHILIYCDLLLDKMLHKRQFVVGDSQISLK